MQEQSSEPYSNKNISAVYVRLKTSRAAICDEVGGSVVCTLPFSFSKISLSRLKEFSGIASASHNQ